ncbi:MAG: preprotein translocase subunit SecE [Acidobacteria bacterium]|nr:preprotein translocase subunit SecE [Acidobacteriota bacterium]
MADKDDSDELPEPSPEGEDSSDVPTGAPGPRTARFGEGAEGRGVRREHGVAGARAGFFARTGQFFRDVRAEMKRVSWPTPREVKNTTFITLVAVIFFAVYLWGVDQLIVQLGRFGGWLLSLVGLG